MKKVFLFFIIALNLCAMVSKADTLKCKIEPEVGIPGDIITIKADQAIFGDKQDKSYVKLSDDPTDKLEIVSWQKDKIEFIVPSRLRRKIVYVNVYKNEEKICTADVIFGLYGIDLVEEAIKLRKGKMQEPSIIDQLEYMSKSTIRESTYRTDQVYFGHYPLTAGQISRLEDAGFQDDFIAKFEGHPQYVTLGLAAMWLWNTADLVFAPMVRIFLKPRSYFHAYRPYIGSFDKSNFLGLFQLDRWDLNFGYTTKTSTIESNDIGEKKNYVLIGLSNQLNRSALLNIGWALVPGDTKGVEGQLYAGFTVDYNFLKGIGIVSK